MYPIVRRTAFNFSVPRNFAISNRSHRILLMALWILSVLFLLAMTGARAQTITFKGRQATVLASGLREPQGVAVDGAGNVYILDRDNSRVLKVTPGGDSGS